MKAKVPVIDLSRAPGERLSWGKPAPIVYLWALVEMLFVYNPLQVSSRFRVFVLRLFGAQIGNNVIFRPRTRVKFPWKLKVGKNSWIGEGVWIHNQDTVSIQENVVISQESFLTTGSHDHRRDMALITRPILIESGVWVTARCVVLGGVTLGRSSLVTPNSVISSSIPSNEIWGGNPQTFLKTRFEVDAE